MENLSSMSKLKTLQIANNNIINIGNSLNACIELKELNLSGNNISSFGEILHLTRLPQLSNFCLNDPNFANNPICLLCNYQTHVIYYLPNLEILDMLQVTEESRQITCVTILKKRMYLVLS